MTITVLAENTVAARSSGLRQEHGLSLHIALPGMSILYDTGASGVFADNAAKLGLDLAGVDLAVVSHGHFDHGGGLARFFELNRQSPVYLRRAAADPHSVKMFLLRRTVGISPEVFRRHPDRFRFIDVFTELVMVIRQADGLVVFTGCGHSGVLNMLEAARARFPGTPLKAVLGGFHLVGVPGLNMMAESEASVMRIGRLLRERGVETTYTGHCTGAKAFRALKAVMGNAVDSLSTGSRIEI
jgi:7,8-dihydropterin-6-yl-methyl-4-(beta-D-ribofuranosyl)aminobenzene 5'-phosphate synthase